MLDICHLDPSDLRAQMFVARGATGTADWQMWTKPRGITQVLLFAVGGGAGGGAGLTGIATADRSGGGGGGSAATTRAVYLASVLPDVLYILPGQGATGGAASGSAGNAGV